MTEQEPRFEPEQTGEPQGIVKRSHLAAKALNNYIAKHHGLEAEDESTSVTNN